MVPDVIIAGSGCGGLTAALVAAEAGLTVLVIEASPVLGGTTAISGGNVWVPDNSAMRRDGKADNAADALKYLQRVTRGLVDVARLTRIIEHGPAMMDFIEANTNIKFICIDRPDYHPEFEGAALSRGVEVAPILVALPDELLSRLRVSPIRAPVTYAEGREGIAAETIAQRKSLGVKTQGAGLVAGLVEACHARGVVFKTDTRARSLIVENNNVVGLVAENGEPFTIRAQRAVMIATGGFEWNDDLTRAYLPIAQNLPITPPWAKGDGLIMGLRVGAAVENMHEAWWTAAINCPGEMYDGRQMNRNIVRDLVLPGSILVNAKGERFVNEALGYNDLGKALLQFDPNADAYANTPSWLIFDAKFRKTYGAATIGPDKDDPEWFISAPTLASLAAAIDVDVHGMTATVERFNGFAKLGEDPDFGRGERSHDRFNGDQNHQPNPCLGEIAEPPFFAVAVQLGINGTKGGLKTDDHARVLDTEGAVINGLFAFGDAAASPMGPGYAGTGAAIGPAMVMSYLASGFVSKMTPLRHGASITQV